MLTSLITTAVASVSMGHAGGCDQGTRCGLLPRGEVEIRTPWGETVTARRFAGVKRLCLSPAEPGFGFGSDVADAAAYALDRERDEPSAVVRSKRGSGGFTLEFNAFGEVTPEIEQALQATADYYAAQFDDETTVVLDAIFESGFFGRAIPELIALDYTVVREALIADADADDTIQSVLPENTLPVRRSRDGAITRENEILLTAANLRALGFDPGPAPDGAIEVSSIVDFDPADGIQGAPGTFEEFSGLDLLVHEVGHAIGFLAPFDVASDLPTSLFLYRFALPQDNPGNAAEFGSFPRALYNEPGFGQQVFDDLDREQPFSVGKFGSPSHWFETAQPDAADRIGVMEPAIFPLENGFPDYFSDNDRAAFDAIGWDRTETPPCPADLAAPFGVLDLADVQAFASAFVAQDAVADLADPVGVYDLADVQAFITAFAAGCP